MLEFCLCSSIWYVCCFVFGKNIFMFLCYMFFYRCCFVLFVVSYNIFFYLCSIIWLVFLLSRMVNSIMYLLRMCRVGFRIIVYNIKGLCCRSLFMWGLKVLIGMKLRKLSVLNYIVFWWKYFLWCFDECKWICFIIIYIYNIIVVSFWEFKYMWIYFCKL